MGYRKLTEQELFLLGWNLGHTPRDPAAPRDEWVCVCDAEYSSSFASHLLRHAYKHLREHGRAGLNPTYLERPQLPPEASQFTPITRRRPKFGRAERSEAPRGRAATPGTTNVVEKHATPRHTAEERAAWRAKRILEREGV